VYVLAFGHTQTYHFFAASGGELYPKRLKQERRRLRHLYLAVYQEIVASNSTNTELNDRIEKAIALLEERDDVADILRVLNGEGNEVYIEREEQMD
jgi:hypothetical protein